MMSKKKWTLLLLVFVIYLFIGGCFFYKIESEHENQIRIEHRKNRNIVLDLLNENYPSHLLEEFLDKLGTYTGYPLINISRDHFDEPQKWDFYHAVFFSFTVVTTVGYGNLAPTLTVSRMFMIVYALIGIPYNGIMYATLGEYFGVTFTNLYKRWKMKKSKDFWKLGFAAQALLYLIPGIIIFIILPAVAFMYFEDWEYDLAVYYAFVTLTTIGFGDYVAGMNRYNQKYGSWFKVYQACILIWMTIGLGYLVMVIGFLTRGLRSKKIRQLEKKVKHNIKNTKEKIYQGFTKDISYLRRFMNELYMAKFKPVYRDEVYATEPIIRVGGSQSFPDLRVLYADSSPETLRRRAMSECVVPPRPLLRAQSDSDLSKIDKDATFGFGNAVPPSDLLAQVVDALAHTEEIMEDEDQTDFDEYGVQGFSDSDILRSEMFGSGWSLGNKSTASEKIARPPNLPRTRASSDVKLPEKVRADDSNDWTWSGPYASKKIEELRAKTKFHRPRARTKSTDTQYSGRQSWLEKFRNSFRRKHEEKKEIEMDQEVKRQQEYIERTAGGRKSTVSISISEERERYLNRTRGGRSSVFSVPETRVLEETTIADLLRALTSLHSRVGSIPENMPEPHRKLGNAGLSPPRIPSSLDLFSTPSNRLQMRRASMAPSMLPSNQRRRFSLHPVRETELPPPPPYSPTLSMAGQRRGSLMPMSTQGGLLHRQVARLKESNEPFRRTRHDSLRDIRIEK